MRRWRRVLHGLVIYGLFGLVVNILVAWAFAAWGEVKPGRVVASRRVTPAGGPIDVDTELSWSRSSPSLTGRPLFRVAAEGRGVRAITESIPTGGGRGSATQLWMGEFGWPARTLRWHDVVSLSDAPTEVGQRGWYVDLPSQRFTSIEMTMLPGFRGLPRRLPLEPMWPGLIANTALFGGAAWLIVGGAWGARVFVRRRRGRCPRCGYDLRRDFKGGCPECGWRRATTRAAADSGDSAAATSAPEPAARGNAGDQAAR